MAVTERVKQYHIVKSFKGLNTKANRTAIDQNEFSWLENAMPIGDSNLRIVPTVSASLASDRDPDTRVWDATITLLTSDNIELNDYIFGFQNSGELQAFNLTLQALITVAPAGTFNPAGAEVTQWKNERVIIGDPTKGLFSWDGNNLVAIGSVGFIGITAPGSGYTSAPAVVIGAPNDPHGTQAVGEATITGNSVAGVFLTQPGTGYTTPPAISFTGGGGSGATAIASLITFQTGTLQLVVAAGGNGYTSTPTISISGGGGGGAAATPIVFGNSITSVVMTNPGSGYTDASTVVATVSGGGGSGAVLTAVVTSDPISDVATFSGRVWVAQGRTITFSAAGSYNDFISVSAGNFIATDTTLHGNINALLAANNFLYWWGADSINVFSDVQVDSNTGATVFTNTNISASIGTELVHAIFPYFRSILFMNRYGVYALVGSTTTKLSDALDGLFPLIDFTKQVTGGQVLIFNILCAAFNFYYQDPVRGTIPLQAVFFDKKWFLTYQGAIDLTTSVPFKGLIHLYGTSGNNLVTMYADNRSAIPSKMQMALSHIGDPVRDKQALKFGLEVTSAVGVALLATIDAETRQSPPYAFDTVISWINNFNQIVGWHNNVGTTIYWVGGFGYQLLMTDAQQNGKYIGLTITSNSAQFTLNTVEYELEYGARF
jgi:hypothetical protein